MKTIKDFLRANAKPDMFNKFSEDIECHIQVAQDNGLPKGKGWTDERDDWYSFRINRPGRQEFAPSYFQHIEAVGLSGWNFKQSRTDWVGFDFDSIVGHNKGLTETEIGDLIRRAGTIGWVEIRKSTSGRGIHFYVPVRNSPSIPARSGHIALAKSILSNLSGLLDFDFRAKVDTCGTILWCWARKGNGEGSFELVKAATEPFNCSTLPPEGPKDQDLSTVLANLKLEKLEPGHQSLLHFLSARPGRWHWNAELNLLITHTHSLTLAHRELKAKGIYQTISSGKDYPNDQNCFLFPLKGGSWIVRRYNPGAQEAPSWQTDKNGWTYCYFNRVPTLSEICAAYMGQQDSKGWWVIPDGEKVLAILSYISPGHRVKIASAQFGRQYRLRSIRVGKIVISTDRAGGEPMEGWVSGKGTWEKVVDIVEEEKEITTPDSEVRHVVTDTGDAGWYLFTNRWALEPKTNIFSALLALGYTPKQSGEVLGQCVLKPWHLVVKPFQQEYPGNREWNKTSAQFMQVPKEGPCPTWDSILANCGQFLTPAVLRNNWCIAHRIITGAEYLRLWVASLFQFPTEPLPYLFFYGKQGSGKSTFHEVLSLLVTPQGVKRADSALKSQSNFNGELLGTVLCIIEELNLSVVKGAYDRVKDWVTAKTISIHTKGETPYDVPNTSHWIHCANFSSYCPVAIGDTRIVFIRMEKPELDLPKMELLARAKIEGAAFLHSVLNLDIPPPMDRLRIPTLETEEKREEQFSTASPVEQYISSSLTYAPGHLIPWQDFVAQCQMWMDKNGYRSADWSQMKIAKAIPLAERMPVKGRRNNQNQYLGNVSFDVSARSKGFYWIKVEDKLVESFPTGESDGTSEDRTV